MEVFKSFSSEYPQLQDYYLTIYFAAALLVARFVLEISVFERLATWLVNSDEGGGYKKHLKDGNEAKILKSKESMWKLTCYITSELFIYNISCNEPWFYDTNSFFDDWPNQTLKLPLKIYYTCQGGFYIYSSVALLAWETRRKDFGVMLSHHIITLTLIGFSYIARCFRIGSMVLALHDVSDLFMESAKLCKYSGKELSASIFFGLFALSWFSLRLIYFPFWIIRSSSYASAKHFDHSNVSHTWLYYIFNTMLITLLVFHLYWWMLICKMIQKQLQNKGRVGEDIRSDSEDED